MWLSVGHKLGRMFALFTTGSQTGSQTDWGKPAGALQFRSGRRRSLACLVVGARDAGSALIAESVRGGPASVCCGRQPYPPVLDERWTGAASAVPHIRSV